MDRGNCKLTGNPGVFVESHLIPKALTRNSIKGKHFIGGGDGRPPRKAWTSWYDRQLVTKEGEEILAQLDNWGISELRRLKLVWSSWGIAHTLPGPEGAVLNDQGVGIRRLRCSDPARLRLFFLSLLWRAAATTLPGFHEVTLKSDELETLRLMLVSGETAPLSFYPATLLQIVTRGPNHNLGPISKDFRASNVAGQLFYKTFRFYFDGLIVHIHRNLAEAHFPKIVPLLVGSSPDLVVQTQTWDRSFEFENMEVHRYKTLIRWPQQLAKLIR